MASSEVDLCNMALDSVGQASILALTDNSEQARACNSRYATARDAVLRAHRWNCATKRAALTELSTAPVWGFSRAFQLPADFVRFANLDDLAIHFRIEGGDDGRVLLTDDTAVNLLYIYRLTTVPQMDEGLKECVAARLAAEIAYKLTGDKQVARDLYVVYQDKLNEARYADSLESPIERFEDRTWLDAARKGGGEFQVIDD